MIISEEITKFHSDFGKFQMFEKYHEGTVENVKVLSRKKVLNKRSLQIIISDILNID